MAGVIETSGLGKRYRIRHEAGGRYSTLREAVAGAVRGLADRALGRPTAAEEDFWALRDVAFTVKAGERVGVIGRNGAGKSTLLKLLSRVSEPSTGRITLRGRVASLLEVGTGFHPELSGRENIYLNGAILGMSREEIRAKFDEIVAFAEVEKFLDTPVKRYSTGMYMRLAFAVAAHLDPEILIVDEVLAVGDAAFQRKCLAKMEDVNASGRTIIFVSHQLNAVQRLCNRCLELESGALVQDTRDVDGAIRRYLHGRDGRPVAEWVSAVGGHRCFTPRRLALSLDGAPMQGSAPVHSGVRVELEADIAEYDPALTAGIALFNEEGTILFWSYFNDGPEAFWPKVQAGRLRLACTLPPHFLNEGIYRIEMIASLHFREWILEPGKSTVAVQLELRGGLSDSPYWFIRRPGNLAPVLDWRAL